jgi:hypothetical protein
MRSGRRTSTVTIAIRPMLDLPDMRRRNVGMRVLPRRGLLCVVWLGYAFDEPTLTWCGPGAIVDTAEATRDAPVGQYELLGGRVGPTGGSACP